MIKILNLTKKRTYLLFKKQFYFSSAADPYYILDVDKNADFKEIKKCFFKLAT